MFKKFYRKSIKHQNFFTKTLQKSRGKQMNFYEILAIDRKSTAYQIKEAYLKLFKEYNPESNDDPGASEKFNMIKLAYETLSNDNNREVYDSFEKYDPHSQEWKYKEEHYQDYERDFFRNKTKYDNYSQNNHRTHTNNNWRQNSDSSNEDNFNNYDNIFKSQFSDKPISKGEDILLKLHISLMEAFNGLQKEINFKRKEKCHSCNGYRSEHGHRPSQCFFCNGKGEILTNKSNSKTCSQCKGIGYLINNPCIECNAQGIMEYEVNEILDIPRGISCYTNIRIEKKGHSDENLGIDNGDLVIMVMVKNTENYKRKNNDLYLNIKISLYQAILGDIIKVDALDSTIDVIVSPGTQNGNQVVVKNKGMPQVNNTKLRGELIIVFQVLIPHLKDINKEEIDLLFKLLNK